MAGWTIDTAFGDCMAEFPIKRATSRGSFWLLARSIVSLTEYGRAVSKHISVAIFYYCNLFEACRARVFTLSIICSWCLPRELEHSSCSSKYPSFYDRSYAGVVLLQPLLITLGRAWSFTILSIWSGGFGAVAVRALRRKGMQSRTARSENQGWKSMAIDTNPVLRQSKGPHSPPRVVYASW